MLSFHQSTLELACRPVHLMTTINAFQPLTRFLSRKTCLNGDLSLCDGLFCCNTFCDTRNRALAPRLWSQISSAAFMPSFSMATCLHSGDTSAFKVLITHSSGRVVLALPIPSKPFALIPRGRDAL